MVTRSLLQTFRRPVMEADVTSRSIIAKIKLGSSEKFHILSCKTIHKREKFKVPLIFPDLSALNPRLFNERKKLNPTFGVREEHWKVKVLHKVPYILYSVL